MMNKSKQHKHKLSIKGFTLVELMISLSIGLVLFSGVMGVFVGLRTTTAETSSYGELQENGRFAISVLTNDLMKQNYWGDYSGPITSQNIKPVPAAPLNECIGGGSNNGTFPLPNLVGNFRTLWGQTVTNPNPMGCFNNANVGSDLLQLKRVIARPLVNTNPNNFFLVASLNKGTIIPNGAVPVIANSRLWQYQHHVYYVRNDFQGTNLVPVLMQGQLTNTMVFAPIIDGIEMIRFMYGIDTNGSGSVNTFVSANPVLGVGGMNEALWDAGNILAVKIYVLARSIRPDNNYTNTSTYQLGNLPFEVNDNYRRLLFSSTVYLYNTAEDSWL